MIVWAHKQKPGYQANCKTWVAPDLPVTSHWGSKSGSSERQITSPPCWPSWQGCSSLDRCWHASSHIWLQKLRPKYFFFDSQVPSWSGNKGMANLIHVFIYFIQLTASQDFVPKLKNHLLSWLLNLDQDSNEDDFTDQDRSTIQIEENQIYATKVLHVKYTTYDVQRDQDSMNPCTHCDIMVLSREDDANAHPYWYACVLGVFHAWVLHTGPWATNHAPQHLEFLWVHWFGTEPDYHAGLKVACLPKIGFQPDSDPEAFGFLNPSLVICGCHLMPAFANWHTSVLLNAIRTLGCLLDETDDWVNYYVNMYVANAHLVSDETHWHLYFW